tara:strand:- start:110 stop:418 length:309 start_codon:yes stop_codon:yes gene_type:complete
MEKNKIDKFIDAFRTAMYSEFSVSEEGMVANPPGGSGGFSSSSPAAGPTAGYDPTLKLDGRNKFVKKAIKDLMDRNQKRKEKKQLKKAMEFNPYFKRNGRSS